MSYFFFSVLLLTVQVAGAYLSPRIIARPFQSKVLKGALSLFVFTFIYSVSTLGRVEDQVPQLCALLTIVLSVASIGMFLFVVEYLGKELRPATVLARVAEEGLKVIRTAYPLCCASGSTPVAAIRLEEFICQSVSHEGRPGVIVAFDQRRLIALAVNDRCVIELVPQVGDFVPTGALLFRVYGAAEPFSAQQVRNAIAVGRERTMEQDPAFAVRIIVDIAEKALSPAINDPTTGVLAIDQIQRLLLEAGTRDLSTGAAFDELGQIRLLYRTPDWEDFVLLAVAEIRHYGASSVQITRRLCGMLEYLINVLPPARANLLQQQLDSLHVSVEKTFLDPRDRVQAGIADMQGLGGRLSQSRGKVAAGEHKLS